MEWGGVIGKRRKIIAARRVHIESCKRSASNYKSCFTGGQCNKRCENSKMSLFRIGSD